MKQGLYILVSVFLVGCNTMKNDSLASAGSISIVEKTPTINSYGKTILERFDTPFGYTRVAVNQNSFASYLRTLPLKPVGTPAHYFDGKAKPGENVYVSVVDMPISPRNLQITANSVMRLISEYLYENHEYKKIAFHTEKEKVNFMEFCKGDYSVDEFHKFMDYVMERMTTPNFCSELDKVRLNDLKIGDVFVQNNLNGHAVIVVDMAVNRKGEKLFLLAQGFQPAQEIQILANPDLEDISPWYHLKEGELLTPEWRFMTSDLMRFKFLETDGLVKN
jgi:hypothetical protein